MFGLILAAALIAAHGSPDRHVTVTQPALVHTAPIYAGESFAQDGHRITVEALGKNASILLDGQGPIMIADVWGSNGGGLTSVAMAATQSGTDPGGGICGNGTVATPVSLCAVVTGTVTLSNGAPLTLSAVSPVIANSNAAPGTAFTLNSQVAPTSFIAALQSAGVNKFTVDASGNIVASGSVTGTSATLSGASPLSLSNASGTSTVASSTTGTLNVTTVAGNGIYGTTFAAPSGTTPAGTISVAGATPLVFSNGVSSPTQFTSAAASTSAAALGANVQDTACTTTNLLFATSLSGTITGLKIQCNGIVITTGNFQPAGISVTGANNIITTSTTAGKGEVITANAAAETANPGDLVMGNTGTLIQASSCAQTTTNASPSLVTLTQNICQLTSGSATATTFTVTLPFSFTSTTPACGFIPAVAILYTSKATGANTCSIVFSSAPTAVLIGTITVFGNGV